MRTEGIKIIYKLYTYLLAGILTSSFMQRPILAVNKTNPFKQFLLTNIPILEQHFWPTFWCVESRAQTVFASILRSQVLPRINYRRELLTLSDGGVVALDWLDGSCSLDAPVVLILPGLTGESQAEYIKFLVLAANQAGLRAVVFNNRGMGGVDLKTRRMYCAANCEDLVEVVQHVARTHPQSKLGATGISMGGLILGNYLAVHSDQAQQYLSSAMIISVPWDVHKGTDSIQQTGINSMLCRHLTTGLVTTVSRYEILRDGDHGWDMEQVLQSRTIKEFDSHFTSKHFGFNDVDEYYDAATLHNKLDMIKTPLLCLSAADDPFQPLEGELRI